MWLLVGLGNPGPQYARNRHNIGFMVIDEIAGRSRAEGFRSKFGADTATCDVAGQKVVLLKPQEYMNVSGRAVQRTAAFYNIDVKEILVVHDEIDFELGTLRVKVGGGHGGHNGIRSMIQDLGASDFVRIRCGVGRPGGGRGGNVANHVLGDFGKADQTEAQILVKEAADAAEEIVKRGAVSAMNRYNVREKSE